eukprot:TRINITY_DN115585_c0_g1_i1.p1 TRINITY_DN115585_c0_g1~~TRINITY_DN115585_c0_g1_i1.p1  ORF type:complete len:260 (-),score=42.30 TRINITY_DN115585_c0_g1_i1:451-1230(-)
MGDQLPVAAAEKDEEGREDRAGRLVKLECVFGLIKGLLERYELAVAMKLLNILACVPNAGTMALAPKAWEEMLSLVGSKCGDLDFLALSPLAEEQKTTPVVPKEPPSASSAEVPLTPPWRPGKVRRFLGRRCKPLSPYDQGQEDLRPSSTAPGKPAMVAAPPALGQACQVRARLLQRWPTAPTTDLRMSFRGSRIAEFQGMSMTAPDLPLVPIEEMDPAGDLADELSDQSPSSASVSTASSGLSDDPTAAAAAVWPPST